MYIVFTKGGRILFSLVSKVRSEPTFSEMLNIKY